MELIRLWSKLPATDFHRSSLFKRLPLEGKCLSCGQVARKVPDEVEKGGFLTRKGKNETLHLIPVHGGRALPTPEEGFQGTT